MVDAVSPGAAGPAVPFTKPPVAANGRPQEYYPDGSAVPDVIAYHHRPEDLRIEGILVLPEASPEDSVFFGEDGLTFGDILDIINPLQHIPVVSSVYRMITGDEIGVGSRLAGGALFGGPLGLLGAGIVAAFESISGDTVERQVASVWKDMTGDESAQLARSTPAAKPDAAPGPAEAEAAVPGAIDDDVSVEPLPAPPVEQLAAAAAARIPAIPPSRVYIQGPDRSISSAIAAPATGRVEKTQPAPSAEAAAERRRIAQAIEQARRAQAGMLLASVAAESSAARTNGGKPDARSGAGETQPFRSHPFMLPPGAPPDMVNKAMAQALDRYEAILRQRTAAATPADPRAIAAPVQ